MKKMRLGILIALGAASASVYSSGNLTHKDWEVYCDNTLTCRIAGYSAEDEKQGGSVLFTRKAGAVTEVEGKVMIADYSGDDYQPKSLTLWINDEHHGLLKIREDHWVLSKQQSLDIIEAVNGIGVVEFRGGEAPFILSSSGATAVFVKADENQGRINTPGALVRKGHEVESGVLNPIPAPIIYQAKTLDKPSRSLSYPERQSITPKLIAAFGDKIDCEGLEPNPDEEEREITLTPLSETHSMLSTFCWRGAYNEGTGYWVIDNELKGDPVLVTAYGTDYTDGMIHANHRGRGLGDCRSHSAWVWDGKRFQHSLESWTGMCRLLRAGGTWDLPTLVSEVKQKK